MLNTKWTYCQMAWDYGPKVRHSVKENQWHYSAKTPSKFLLQTSWWLKTAFLFFSFPVSVYFCTTLLLNANVCLSRICLEDFLRTSVRSVFCQCFRHPCPPLCPWVARVTRGGLEGTSAHVGLCACDGSASQCGPPTRPRDSWGPLRQLRPTAHSDSVIMGGLLLRFAVTRRRAHARAPTQKLHLKWPVP